MTDMPVVLVQGPGPAPRPLAENLGTGHRLLVPWLGDQPTAEAYAERLADAIRDAGPDRVVLVGESLGTVIAAVTAATYPELVRGLVLIGGWANAGSTRDRFVADLWLDLLAADRELAVRFSVAAGFSPAVLDELGDSGLVRVLAGLDRPGRVEFATRLDIRPELARIGCPTLVVGFSADQLVAVTGARNLHAGIPGSRYAELPGGHYDWLVRPAELLARVDEFLGDLVEVHPPQVRP